MIVGEDIFIMLLIEPYFQTFTKKKIADATKGTESIICLSADSKEKVDELIVIPGKSFQSGYHLKC